jgi:hypothetical protein
VLGLLGLGGGLLLLSEPVEKKETTADVTKEEPAKEEPTEVEPTDAPEEGTEEK